MAAYTWWLMMVVWCNHSFPKRKAKKNTLFSVHVKRDYRGSMFLDVGGQKYKKGFKKKFVYVIYEYVNILKNHNNIWIYFEGVLIKEEVGFSKRNQI